MDSYWVNLMGYRMVLRLDRRMEPMMAKRKAFRKASMMEYQKA